MKPDRRSATLVACILLVSLVIAQGSDRRTRLSQVRSVSLPSSAVLDDHAQPLIASSGKVGFIASVTGGSLISFSVTSGRILSSVAVGETLGSISMVEASGRRLIAVPAVNDPAGGGPATVSIVDATSAKHLELKSLLVLPSGAHITPATAAVLTHDGRFCVIASSFDAPTLYSFDVDSGQLVSHLPLNGRPSEIAFHDGGGRRSLAVVSVAANNLWVIRIDDQGVLTSGASFSPSIGRFEEANNPAFSSNGGLVYVAASTGDRLFAIDAESGIIIDSISIPSPRRITVAATPDGIDLIAATRVRLSANARPSGVTIIANQEGRLLQKSEFTPPDDIEFSPANNVAFTQDALTAFVGSTTAILFAFSTETGELESYQQAGGALRRIALSENTHSIAAVRSSQSGDEVAIINFEIVGPDEGDPSAPVIESLSPHVVEQGRVRNLKLVVTGTNFTDGSSLLVNGIEMGADLVKRGRALQTKLPKSLFDQIRPISVEVKAANGAVSQPKALNVIRPGAPSIDKITPTQVPGPSEAFALTVKGTNFRISSAIVVAGQPLNTEQIGAKTLQAVVPAEIAGLVRKTPLKVQVKDLAVSDLVSTNDKDLLIFGPRINDLRPSVNGIVAGDRRFTLRIIGENFRDGAEVRINGTTIPAEQITNVTKKLIKLVVPDSLFQDAGKLRVLVRNRAGGESDPEEVVVHGPEISSIAPGKVFAGVNAARVDVFGKNFRRRPRVYVTNGSKALQIAPTQVRFRSDTHIVVTLAGESSALLEKPDTLQFEIVNRNAGDGVPSGNHSLEVVGPSITGAVIEPVADDDSRVQVTIEGSNFRPGAIVEFIKDGATVLQQPPVRLNEGVARVVVRTKQVEALGSFQVRIVNRGNMPVPSKPFQPRHSEVASNEQ